MNGIEIYKDSRRQCDKKNTNCEPIGGAVLQTLNKYSSSGAISRRRNIAKQKFRPVSMIVSNSALNVLINLNITNPPENQLFV
jgi:hypothetical protein